MNAHIVDIRCVGKHCSHLLRSTKRGRREGVTDQLQCMHSVCDADTSSMCKAGFVQVPMHDSFATTQEILRHNHMMDLPRRFLPLMGLLRMMQVGDRYARQEALHWSYVPRVPVTHQQHILTGVVIIRACLHVQLSVTGIMALGSTTKQWTGASARSE